MDTLTRLIRAEEASWLNPELKSVVPKFTIHEKGYIHVLAAQNRFMRFLPYFADAFPETAAKKGVIESALLPIDTMRDMMNSDGAGITGRVMLKDDAHLPIAGSVKARGGIHAVLHIAENLVQKHNMLMPGGDYKKIADPEFKAMFSQYSIHVASTGNLGISVGRMASKMGFRTVVHMSRDAKEWKKQLLRAEGCEVREYDSDYTTAVRIGRDAAEEANAFFIDDENSEDLFFGYSSAAMRLKVQLRNMGIVVNETHPLFVYLPCGVGGAPSGICFGLKQMFGDCVHCFFAEPVQAPCFTLGMATRKFDQISINDIGLKGDTIADGLAVGRVSGFSCKMMDSLVSGAYTVSDEHILMWQNKLIQTEGIFVEPSACAGFGPLNQIARAGSELNCYIAEHGLEQDMENALHIVWATGGGLMPFSSES